MLGSDPIQFNEGDDDLQSSGEGQMASSTDGAESNRPAANANLSETVDATTEDFEFQDEADDFLGLEGEVQALEAASETDSASDGSFNVGDDGELDLSDGWLLEVASEENTAPVEEPAASTSIESADPEQIEQLVTDTIASTVVDEEEFEAETMAGDDEDYEFESDEDYDGEFEDEFEVDELAEDAPQRSKKLVVIGFCAGILGTVGLLLLDSGTASDGIGTEVATGVATAPTQPTNAEGAEAVADTSATDVATTTEEPESNEPIENVLEGLLAAPTEITEPVNAEPITFAALPDPVATSDPIAAMPSLPSLPSMPDLTPVDIDMPTQDEPRTVLAQLAQGAENGDISGFMDFTPASGAGFIWTGEMVPMESISTKGRILTPAVGIVRATMNSGELFEGNLYAVGSNRVWIEMGPGRVGLDGSKVQKIERVVAETLEAEQAEAALGQRVRVRAAGGVLYGKVKSREGNRVTIITDKGARITLIDPEIEAIGRLSGLVLN